jgi:hypothetical protein
MQKGSPQAPKKGAKPSPAKQNQNKGPKPSPKKSGGNQKNQASDNSPKQQVVPPAQGGQGKGKRKRGQNANLEGQSEVTSTPTPTQQPANKKARAESPAADKTSNSPQPQPSKGKNQKQQQQGQAQAQAQQEPTTTPAPSQQQAGKRRNKKKKNQQGQPQQQQDQAQSQPQAQGQQQQQPKKQKQKNQQKGQQQQQQVGQGQPQGQAQGQQQQQSKKQKQKNQQKGQQQQPKQQQNQQTKPKGGKNVAEAGSWLEWLLGTEITVAQFFADYWEQKPLLVKKQQRTKAYPTDAVTAKLPPNLLNNSTLFSNADLHKILKENEIYYTRNLNIFRYANGTKETLNPEGPASSEEVKKFYNEGSTIQFFQPQRHSKILHSVVASMEAQFGSLTGANVYLTPPNSQGLAPHYDDVEAFILQTEGKKKWRLYSLLEEERLPYEYSPDIPQDELPKPLLEVELNAGDVLYFPRGTIHQACTSSVASTHITFSTYQHNSWADYLRVALPLALEQAVEEDIEFRRGLPVNFLSYMGVVFEQADDDEDEDQDEDGNNDEDTKTPKQKKMAVVKEDKDPRQEAFSDQVGKLLDRLPQYLRLHEAADIFAQDFVCNRMPPVDSPFLQIQEGDANDAEKEAEAGAGKGKQKEKGKGKGKEQEKKKDAEKGKDEETKEEDEEEDETGLVVNEDSMVRLYDPSWLRLVIPHPDDKEADDDEFSGSDDDDDEDEEADAHEHDHKEDSDGEQSDSADEEAQLQKLVARYRKEKEQKGEKGKGKGKGKQGPSQNGNADDHKDDEKHDHGDSDEDDEDGGEEDDGGEVLLMHSLANDRETHMEGAHRGRHLRLPEECYPALVYLWRSYPEYVPLHSLPALPPEAKVEFAVNLVIEGVLQLQSPAAAQ